MLQQAVCDYTPVPLYVHQAFAVLNPAYQVPYYLDIHIDPDVLAAVFAEEDERIRKSDLPAMEQLMNRTDATKKASLDELVVEGLISKNPLTENYQDQTSVVRDISNSISHSRICQHPAAIHSSEPRNLEFVNWLEPRPMAAAPIYHKLPEELRDIVESKSDYLEEFELNALKSTPLVRERYLKPSVYEWLEFVSGLAVKQAAEEAMSANGVRMANVIGKALFDGYDALNDAVADHFEVMGYRAAMDRQSGLMLLDLPSGTFVWQLA